MTWVLADTVFVKLVVLTGGFGRNKFLQKEFSERFGAMMHFTDPWG
jgi:hypothetical protein